MARVQISGERGDFAPPRHGLWQGAALSPPLFLLFLDDLLETRKVALFADYVSLVSSHDNKLAAEKELQRAVTAVTKWSTSKLMVLNADKYEVTFFSTNSHEANWQPTNIVNSVSHPPRLERGNLGPPLFAATSWRVAKIIPSE